MGKRNDGPHCVDQLLAQNYGFTEEELDFIINYDIKYRMGPPRRGTTGREHGHCAMFTER